MPRAINLDTTEIDSLPPPGVSTQSFWAQREVMIGLPGMAEKALAWLTFFVMIHGLPAGWYVTSEQRDFIDGNANVFLVQLLLIGLCVARVVGSFDWLLRAIRLDGALFAFVAVAAASFFWSADPVRTLRQSVVLAAVTLFAVYLVLRFPLAEILLIWASVFALSAVLNIYFIVAEPVYAVQPKGEWSGVFPQKNALGRVALQALPVLVAAARGTPRFRWPFYASGAMYVALLIGSQSKTMLLGIGASLGLAIVYMAFRGRKTLRGMAYLGLITGMGLAISLTLVNLEFLADLVGKDVSFTGRIPLWQELWPIAAAEPVLGYGYKAAFGGYFSPIHEVWVANPWEPGHAHNDYLAIFMQVGFVGLGLYLVMMLRAVSRSVRTVIALPGAVGLWPLTAITSVLVTSVTEAGMTGNPSLWMMFVVAALASAHHAADNGATADSR